MPFGCSAPTGAASISSSAARSGGSMGGCGCGGGAASGRASPSSSACAFVASCSASGITSLRPLRCCSCKYASTRSAWPSSISAACVSHVTSSAAALQPCHLIRNWRASARWPGSSLSLRISSGKKAVSSASSPSPASASTPPPPSPPSPSPSSLSPSPGRCPASTQSSASCASHAFSMEALSSAASGAAKGVATEPEQKQREVGSHTLATVLQAPKNPL
eukprot:scaffold102483_cov63-Phaeocystis_antarctica.AAC.2